MLIGRAGFMPTEDKVADFPRPNAFSGEYVREDLGTEKATIINT
jgi:hypothetical protein